MTAPRAARAERWITITSSLAGVALLLILAGGVFLAVPVRNPRVQDCGTPIGFLLDARLDTYVDPAKPPRGMTKAQASAANADRCRARVADRAVPGGELIGAGMVLGAGAALAEWWIRSRRRRALLAQVGLLPPPVGAPLPPITSPAGARRDSPG